MLYILFYCKVSFEIKSLILTFTAYYKQATRLHSFFNIKYSLLLLKLFSYILILVKKIFDDAIFYFCCKFKRIETKKAIISLKIFSSLR